jgi:transposase InsO family protein
MLRRLRSLARNAWASLRSLLSRAAPDLEKLALRQQLASVCAKPHPRPTQIDRLFWVVLSSLWPGWRSALAFVRPETVVRWHRAGWRLFWRFKSRRRGRPPIDHTLRDLIVTMATDNPTWGAPRIHGELLKLGYSIVQSTVSKYLPPRPRNRSPNSPDWHTFLRLHLKGSVGIDFFDIPTATFKLLYGFVVLDHERRKILHLGVTDQPTAEWGTNQLRLAFENTDGPERVFHDRGGQFNPGFSSTTKALGAKEVISAPHSPWQNPFAERVIGSIRRELLDHVIVLGERHAVLLLRKYQAYYNASRTHLGLDKDSPEGRPVQPIVDGDKVVAIPILGGLHHRYERRAA